MNRVVFVLLLIVIFSQSSFGQTKTLDADAFNAGLKASPEAIVLDVRTPEEVKQGALPGAVNIDYNDPGFQKNIAALDRNKVYFVYCAKGVRSSKAVDVMEDLGFTHINNLDGGFVGWKEKGLPVTKK